jgi:hypothetical protein
MDEYKIPFLENNTPLLHFNYIMPMYIKKIIVKPIRDICIQWHVIFLASSIVYPTERISYVHISCCVKSMHGSITSQADKEDPQ